MPDRGKTKMEKGVRREVVSEVVFQCFLARLMLSATAELKLCVFPGRPAGTRLLEPDFCFLRGPAVGWTQICGPCRLAARLSWTELLLVRPPDLPNLWRADRSLEGLDCIRSNCLAIDASPGAKRGSWPHLVSTSAISLARETPSGSCRSSRDVAALGPGMASGSSSSPWSLFPSVLGLGRASGSSG